MINKIKFKDGNHNICIVDISAIRIVGDLSKVNEFFYCFNQLIDLSKLSYSEKLISDRLYRRYVKFEDFDKIEVLMNEVRLQFSKIQLKDIKIIANNTSNETLDKYFNKFFTAIYDSIETTKYFKETGKYEDSNFSIRLVCSDLPFNVLDRRITEKQLDALSEDSKPIWMVPRFIEKKMDDHIKRIEKRNDDIIRTRKEKQTNRK